MTILSILKVIKHKKRSLAALALQLVLFFIRVGDQDLIDCINHSVIVILLRCSYKFMKL